MPKTMLPDNLQRRKAEKMPSFVRFLPDHEYIHYLEIPPDVFKYLGNRLCGKVTLNLRVSSNRSWNARVRKLPTGLAFVDGWEDFVRDNSLQGNELLKFNYEGTKHFSIAIFTEHGFARLDCPNVVSDQSPNFAKNTKRPRRRTRIQPVRYCKRLRQMNSRKDDTVMIISSSSESEESEELNVDKDSTYEDQEAPGPESSRSMLSNKDKRHGEQVDETENVKEQGSEDGNCDGGEHDSEDGENMDNNEEGRLGNDGGNIYEQLFIKNLIDEVNELVDEVEEKDKLISELNRDLESCQKIKEDLGKARNENSRLLERIAELAKEKELMQLEIEQLRQK